MVGTDVLIADTLTAYILESHAAAWETLAQGSNQDERDIAALLRSVIQSIEGPHPADWRDVRKALEYALAFARARCGDGSLFHYPEMDGSSNATEPHIKYVVY
jgi:hypothetical protein